MLLLLPLDQSQLPPLPPRRLTVEMEEAWRLQ